MLAVADGPGTLRFSLAKVPMSERANAVQTLYERKLFPVQLNILPDKELRFDVTWKLLPGLGILSGFFAGLRAEGLVEPAGNEDLTLAMSMTSTAAFLQRHRQALVGPNTAIVTTREFGTFSLVGLEAGRCVGLRIPRKAIAALVPDVDDAVRRLTIPNASALMLLAKYAETIAKNRATVSPEFARMIVQHVHDLLAMLLGAKGDAAQFARGRGVKAARLSVIKTDILNHLGECDLKASAVALRQGVSPRYVHKLFEGEGTTFSEFVLRERLASAYRNFGDSRFHHRLISSIAYEAGFGDLSHFNHCFRRRYGITPSDVRAQSRVNLDVAE